MTIQADLTYHSSRRAAQRNLSNRDIDYVLRYGTRMHRAGAIFYYLRICDIPLADQKISHFTRLVGTAIVASRDTGEIMTVWRNRKKGWRNIERKNRSSCKNEVFS